MNTIALLMFIKGGIVETSHGLTKEMIIGKVLIGLPSASACQSTCLLIWDVVFSLLYYTWDKELPARDILFHWKLNIKPSLIILSPAQVFRAVLMCETPK